MGIYDRDYYRESSSRWSNWGDRPVTVGLVVTNCVIFLLQLLTPIYDEHGRRVSDLLSEWGAFHLPSILQGQVWRVVTAHFLHDSGGLWHLALNMFVLFWVGTELEGIYGSKEFLSFYMVSALLVSFGMIVLGLTGLQPREIRGYGASGAVNAAFVLFACHYPYRTIMIFFIIPAPAWLVAVGLLMIDFFGYFGVGDAGVGYAAHLLGAAFGFIYYRYSLRVSTWLPAFGRRAPTRRGPSPRIFTDPPDDESDELPVSAPTPPAPRAAASPASSRNVDEQLEAKLDLVLEKVSRYGRDSLTPEEKDLLLRASEIYKRRRR
jgi:membrane associated rhomboid family serine protease